MELLRTVPPSLSSFLPAKFQIASNPLKNGELLMRATTNYRPWAPVPAG